MDSKPMTPIPPETVERAAREPTDAELAESLRGLARFGVPERSGYWHDLHLAADRLSSRGEISEALKIDLIGGNCPAQAEGTIDGKPFYFRARGEHWSFGVGADPVGEPDWYHAEQWGDGPFSAGWMPEDTARRIIDWCARAYLQRATLSSHEKEG